MIPMDMYEWVIASILGTTAIVAVGAKLKEIFDAVKGNPADFTDCPHIKNAPPNWPELMSQNPDYHPLVMNGSKSRGRHRSGGF